MARLLLSGPVKTNQTASHRENVVSTPGFAAKSTPCKIRYLRPCVPCMFRQHCSTWAKAAELTHGALYAHFPSKDALVAEAFSHGFEKNLKATARPKAECSFQDHLTALFAASARDDLAGGCPMAASASEIGRQDGEVSARFASAFEQMVTTLEASLGDEEGATPNRQLAVATVA